jgi:PLP dependent protein
MWERRLKEEFARVRERIDGALVRAGRSDSVRIVAVTKGHPAAAVEAAVALGLGSVGENRIQELEEKVTLLGRGAAEWHMIGHLQRNKVRSGVPLFDWIHSVDSLRLARDPVAGGGAPGRAGPGASAGERLR